MRRTNLKVWLLENTSNALKDNRQYYFKLAEQSDKIVVWLVGFSVTAIVLTIGKIGKITTIHEDLSRIILIFSSLTIIFGLLYRIFLYVSQFLELKILSHFDLIVYTSRNPPIVNTVREINDDDTYYDVINFIAEDFNEKIERKDISQLKQEEIDVLRNYAVEYYNALCSWDKKIIDKDKREIKEIFIERLGFSKRYVDKIFENPKSNKLTFWIYRVGLYFSRIFFITTCLCFVIGIVLILINTV